jgi:hypothetical protein
MKSSPKRPHASSPQLEPKAAAVPARSGGNRLTAEEILSIHTDIFNRALKEQDYAALEGLYADDYMLVRPDGSVLNKQEVLHDLRSGGLRFHSIKLGQPEVRMYGPTAVLTAESHAVSSRYGMEPRSHFRLRCMCSKGRPIKLVPLSEYL